MTIGGEDFLVPELKIKPLREWKEQFNQGITGIDKLDPNSPKELGQLMDVGSVTILDMVLKYDATEALGGRDWIEENATEVEVYRAFREMLDAAFPFVRDAMGAMGQVQAMQAAAASPSASSTNGHSQTGASTPKASKKG